MCISELSFFCLQRKIRFPNTQRRCFMAFSQNQSQKKDTKHDFKANKRTLSESENENFWFQKINDEKKTGDELIQSIVSEIEAKPSYYKNVGKMCRHLDKIMSFFYKHQNVKVLPFGSAKTKLAIGDSDVDIYIDFNGNFPEPPETLLRTLKNKVKKFGFFTRTIPIFAKIPILQCLHCSGLSCDISFLNPSAVSNSMLIKFLLSLDVRIRPLILIVKYVLKTHGLIETHALTSYTVVMLVVFFLQTLEKPIIPSISVLQNLAPNPNVISDWNAAFTTNTNLLPEVNNNLSITVLVHKFFHFYASFEFGFYVISVFTAKSLLKPIFSDINLLPEEFDLYRKNLSESKCGEFEYKKFLCVQDPFIHCLNITRNTTQKSLIQFQQLCCNYSTHKPDLFDKNELEEKSYLLHLFQLKAAEPSSKKIKAIEPIYVGQQFSFHDPICSEDDLRNEWSKQVFQSIIDILTKVMKCEVDIHSEISEIASSSFENEEKQIHCVFHYLELINKKRNEVKTELEIPKDVPVINQEEIISNYLCDTVIKDSDKLSVKFVLNCIVKRQPTCFCVSFNSHTEMIPNQQLQIFQQLFKFLQNSFQKWIKW